MDVAIFSSIIFALVCGIIINVLKTGVTIEKSFEKIGPAALPKNVNDLFYR